MGDKATNATLFGDEPGKASQHVWKVLGGLLAQPLTNLLPGRTASASFKHGHKRFQIPVMLSTKEIGNQPPCAAPASLESIIKEGIGDRGDPPLSSQPPPSSASLLSHSLPAGGCNPGRACLPLLFQKAGQPACSEQTKVLSHHCRLSPSAPEMAPQATSSLSRRNWPQPPPSPHISVLPQL